MVEKHPQHSKVLINALKLDNQGVFIANYPRVGSLYSISQAISGRVNGSLLKLALGGIPITRLKIARAMSVIC